MQSQEENCIPIPELYDIKNRNYEWEQFKYQLPAYYASPAAAPTQFRRTKDPHKSNYIDDVQRLFKDIPAPNAYTPIATHRSVYGKMDKAARDTPTDAMIRRSKKENMPGPASYIIQRPKTATETKREGRHQREHYLHDVEYQSNLVPGVGEYEAAKRVHTHVSGPKIMKMYKELKQMKSEKKSKFVYSKKYDVVVPGTFQWLSRQNKCKDRKFFSSSKRFAEVQASSPAPNCYNLNQTWTDKVNEMNTLSSTSLRSVYYG